MTPPRLVQLDILRGLAVFGILLVNIWSFSWGSSSLRYGALPPDAPFADSAVIFVTAWLAELKFYPVFAFLFGAGFALQTRSLKRQLEDPLGSWLAAQQRYRRRLLWLLGCGMLHGLLVWSGDVLTAYAVGGLMILPLAPARLHRVRTRVIWLVCIFTLFIVTLSLAVGWVRSPSFISDAWLAFENSRAIYTEGSVWDIARQRIGDYLFGLVMGVFMLPHTVVLFLLGLLAVRLGWLTRPQRHRALWRRVRLLGLGLGVPLNLLWACACVAQAQDIYQTRFNLPMLELMMYYSGPVLAAGYIASLMLAGQGVLDGLTRWIEPVGRMALTNYLLQSLMGTWLLQGGGFGWGAGIAPRQMMLLAVAIMLIQVAFSRWWMARYEQGPIEAFWRHFVHGKRTPPARNAR